MRIFSWFLKDDNNGSKMTWAIVILIVALGVSILWGAGNSQKNRKHTRELEAAQAEGIPSLVTARDDALVLAESERIAKEELEARGIETRIVESIRTVSNPINVELRTLVIRQRAAIQRQADEHTAALDRAIVELARDRPECEGLIRPSDCPPPALPDLQFNFHITSSAARLESNAGNTFATGSNSIFEGSCSASDGTILPDETCTQVGTAPWRTDVTQLIRAPAPARSRILGFYGGIHYGLSLDETSATASCKYRSSECDPSTVSLSLARFRPYGGVEWRFQRLALRTGAYGDTNSMGLDIGVSFHRER